MKNSILSFIFLFFASCAFGNISEYSILVKSSGENPIEFEIPNAISDDVTIPILSSDLGYRLLSFHLYSKESNKEISRDSFYVTLTDPQQLKKDSNASYTPVVKFASGYPMVFDKEVLLFKAGKISLSVKFSRNKSQAEQGAAANP